MKKQTKKKSTKKDLVSKITIDKLVDIKTPMEKMEEKLKLQTDAGGHAILRALPDGSFKDTEF